ncbi:MAG: S1C family serine protease [Proteobacteria bacterium]|nr:S1C family serine protease [Pseudomonadota bacterium]
MKTKFLVIGTFLLVAFNFNATAASLNDKLIHSIVKIKSYISSEARTAQSLGTEREGSGIIIDKTGHILTVGYLILEAETVEVTSSDGTTRPAMIIGYDYDTGFGLIRAKNASDAIPMNLGKSSKIRQNDVVLVAVFQDYEPAKGAFVISRQDYAGYWEYLLEDAIFVSPPMNQFGGAALISKDGALVGVGSLFTQLSVKGFGTVSCNVFIPIDRLMPILTDLKQNGRSRAKPKPWLGMYANEVQGHVIVYRTAKGGPAEKAGLQPNDIILNVGKTRIEGLADFYRKLWATGSAGVNVNLTILRKTKVQTLKVKTDDRTRFFRTLGGRQVRLMSQVPSHDG